MFRMVAGYSSDGPGHPGNSEDPAVRLEGASLWLELSRYAVFFNPAAPEGSDIRPAIHSYSIGIWLI